MYMYIELAHAKKKRGGGKKRGKRRRGGEEREEEGEEKEERKNARAQKKKESARRLRLQRTLFFLRASPVPRDEFPGVPKKVEKDRGGKAVLFWVGPFIDPTFTA